MVCHVLCLSFVYFKPTFRLPEFRLFKCFLFCFVFFICFVVSLKRATSSANLKLVRFSPSALIFFLLLLEKLVLLDISYNWSQRSCIHISRVKKRVNSLWTTDEIIRNSELQFL